MSCWYCGLDDVIFLLTWDMEGWWNNAAPVRVIQPSLLWFLCLIPRWTYPWNLFSPSFTWFHASCSILFHYPLITFVSFWWFLMKGWLNLHAAFQQKFCCYFNSAREVLIWVEIFLASCGCRNITTQTRNLVDSLAIVFQGGIFVHLFVPCFFSNRIEASWFLGQLLHE